MPAFILDIPNELQHRIAEEIALDNGPGFSPATDLRNLALTCRQLRPVAQERLVRAPKLFNYIKDHSAEGRSNRPNHHRLLKFVRTLLERPDLASKVCELSFRVCTQSVCPSDAVTIPQKRAIEHQCAGFIRASTFDTERKKNWAFELFSHNHWCGALCGTMLAMLSNLRKLNFSTEILEETPFLPLLFGNHIDAFPQSGAQGSVPVSSASLVGLGDVGGLKTLRHLALEDGAVFLPLGLRFLPNLNNVSLAVRCTSLLDQGGVQDPKDFEHITHLRLSCCPEKVVAEVSEWFSSATQLFTNFSSLQHLSFCGAKDRFEYDFSPDYEEAYFSNTFNHDDELHGEMVAGGEVDAALIQRSYGILLEVIDCDALHQSLETLELPVGFWARSWEDTATGVHLTAFCKLRRLMLCGTVAGRVQCGDGIEIVSK